jgi:hypothetical protein
LAVVDEGDHRGGMQESVGRHVSAGDREAARRVTVGHLLPFDAEIIRQSAFLSLRELLGLVALHHPGHLLAPTAELGCRAV